MRVKRLHLEGLRLLRRPRAHGRGRADQDPRIVAETGAEINIEDDGSIRIYSNNPEAMARAKQIINGMTKEVTIGEVYHAPVVNIKEFGCFVEILPGKDGMCHISELADRRVNRVEDVVKMGEMIWVKVLGVDERGKIKLSRKAAMKERDEAAGNGAPAAPAPAPTGAN